MSLLKKFCNFGNVKVIACESNTFSTVNKNIKTYFSRSCVSQQSFTISTPFTNLLKLSVWFIERRTIHHGVLGKENSGCNSSIDTQTGKSDHKTWPLKKKRKAGLEPPKAFQISAYATAHSYDINPIKEQFQREGFCASHKEELNSADDFGYPDNILRVESPNCSFGEKKDIYIFKEGMTVFWNFSKEEQIKLLDSIKKFENDPYCSEVIDDEIEILNYKLNNSKANTIDSGRNLVILPEDNYYMEKFTISHALAMSVKLGILETNLSDYVAQIGQFQEICHKDKVLLSREQVKQYGGELCNLKHFYNNLEFSYVPDFCWENENLEALYYKVLRFLDVRDRSSLLGDRLQSCTDLVELLRNQFDVSRAHRMEVIIAVLIGVEILQGCLHYMN